MPSGKQSSDPMLFTVEAIFPGEDSWSIREIVADGATLTANGALHIFDKAPGRTSPRRAVLLLAPDKWRGCEPQSPL